MNEITCIKPFFWDENSPMYDTWLKQMESAEKAYFDLLKQGAKPQEARSVLPHSLKTEIYVTMNLREWRHFFKTRTAFAVHPQMLELTIPLLDDFISLLPEVFEPINFIVQ
jgi:thymidylate synthase (FAD)